MEVQFRFFTARKTKIKFEFHFPIQLKIGWDKGTRIHLVMAILQLIC